MNKKTLARKTVKLLHAREEVKSRRERLKLESDERFLASYEAAGYAIAHTASGEFEEARKYLTRVNQHPFWRPYAKELEKLLTRLGKEEARFIQGYEKARIARFIRGSRDRERGHHASSEPASQDGELAAREATSVPADELGTAQAQEKWNGFYQPTGSGGLAAEGGGLSAARLEQT